MAGARLPCTTGTSTSSVPCVSLRTMLGWNHTNKARPDPLLCEELPRSLSFRGQLSPRRAQLQAQRAAKIPPGASHSRETLQRVPW